MRAMVGAMRALGAATAVIVAAWAGTAPAAAGSKDAGFATGGPEFSVNATVTTDYRFRGFTQTRENTALQGGFDVIWPHFYVGLWASSVSFENPIGFGDADGVELVPYIGLKRDIFGYNIDLRAMYYAYPGMRGLFNVDTGTLKDADYFELMLGWSREVLPQLTLGTKVYYSPDYQGKTGQNWVVESGVARKFGEFRGVAPTVSAKLGSSYGDESKGGFDYYYWNAGVSFVFANYFELDLRYFDTFDVPSSALAGGTCANLCDGRFVARITFEN